MNAHCCAVCSGTRHALAALCERCKRIRDRLDTRAGAKANVAAREKALKAAWDASAGAFRCHYSGVTLDDDPASPWHLALDHRTPRDDSDIVACAALINAMKSDLTEAEFRTVVAQLAEKFSGGRASIDRLAPAHWRRG